MAGTLSTLFLSASMSPASPNHRCPVAPLAATKLPLTMVSGESAPSAWIDASTSACAPVADFDVWPQSGNAPLTVSMHNISSGNYNSCFWEYGDGATGASCDGYHDHTYAAAGIYTVRLTVTGPGGSNTKTRTGYITVTSPCYTLSRTHSGSGSDPVASPANSSGCSTGQYVVGHLSA